MPQDPPRTELPPWLPWATAACLAALVACLGELWIIEKTRSQLLSEQAALAGAALKAAQNQLEAERIVSGREIAGLRAAPGAQAALRAALLFPPAGPPGGACGAVAWDARGGGLVRLHGLPAPGPDSDYQLWLEGPGAAADCGVLRAPPAQPADGFAVRVPAAPAPGGRFVLAKVARGGAASLAEAEARGSIVLASLPFTENISSR